MRDYRLYISDMIDSINKIQSYTKDIDINSFHDDSKTHDAVLQNLLIIGEAANKIPDSIQNKFPEIDWRGVVGMRNIIIHGYFNVNSDIIWKTVKNNLPELLNQIKKINK